MKLWETKEGGGDEIASAVESFTVGRDFLTDISLVPWDCYGSAAHARGLAKIGIITDQELAALLGGLSKILEKSQCGEFPILPSQEDCHTAIEDFLVKDIGETGKKIHAGRSRNDQVLTAIKLFSKAHGFVIQEQCCELAETLMNFAKKNPVQLPGYTHMQKAMPSSIPLWAESYGELLLDSASHLGSVRELIDTSPLGSAAGYGVTLPLDRGYTSQLLGFDRVQNNVIAAQSSRGKNEAALISALALIMLDLGKLAADLLFFSQQELGYLSLPERFCTGSSIMPQKKNPDVLELMRAKAKVVANLHAQVLSIASDLPSGYNRDLQLTKEPLFQAFEIVGSALTIMKAMVPGLTVNKERCEQAMTQELYAADAANELVGKGMPFRDAYREIKQKLERGDDLQITSSSKRHLTADESLKSRLISLKSAVSKKREKFEKILDDLI